MGWAWLHSPGAPSGIGPMAEIGPGGAYAGRIVGMGPALKLIGDLGGPAVAGYLNYKKKVKDFNDQEGTAIEGQSRGRVVTTGPSQPRSPGGGAGTPPNNPPGPPRGGPPAAPVGAPLRPRPSPPAGPASEALRLPFTSTIETGFGAGGGGPHGAYVGPVQPGGPWSRRRP
jgi:hypothetical protein